MQIKNLNASLIILIVLSMAFVLGCETVENNDDVRKDNAETLTIADIAFDGYGSSNFIDNTLSTLGLSKEAEISEEKYTVYIEEDSQFVPYLVLTSDYNGNTLLLRKYVLEEEQIFNEESWDIYFKDSVVDRFLNNEYITTLDPFMQDNIVNTQVLVTRRLTNELGNRVLEPYPIDRKVFLLSSTELGINSVNIAKEGEPLKYFEDLKDYFAYPYEGGEAQVWYLRTPYYGSSGNGIWVVGANGQTGLKGILDFLADRRPAKASVRPAFCVSNTLLIEESDDLIEGKTVYVIKR